MEEEQGHVDSGPQHQQRHRVTLWTKLAYGTGHVLNDMCASMWFTYLLIFFHSVLKFDNLFAGLVLLSGQLADGLSTLFVGFFLDAGDDLWLCNKLGKRHSWHLVGTFCVLASFPFIFMPCLSCSDADQAAQLVYFVAFVVVFQFGWASTQISHLSMIPALTSCENERTALTSVRYGATVLANTAVFGVTWAWIGVGDRDSDFIGPCDAVTFRNVAAVCLSVGGFASLVFHLTVKFEEANVLEDVPDTDSEATFAPDDAPIVERPTVRPMAVKDWLQEPQFFQVGVVYMATRLFVNISQSYMPFYLQSTLRLHATYVAVIPLVVFLAGFLLTFVMKHVTKTIGRKWAFALSCLTAISGCAWIYIAGIHSPTFTKYELFGVAVLMGAGGSGMLITSLSITADLISNNLDSSAFVYGSMSLADKFSNGIAIMIIQHSIPKPCGCPDEGIYFQQVLVWVCGGAALLGFLAVVSLVPVKIGSRRRDTRVAVNRTLDVPEPQQEPEDIIN